jgi:hypothetical protein
MRPVALGRRSCWDRCSAESGETVVGLVEGVPGAVQCPAIGLEMTAGRTANLPMGTGAETGRSYDQARSDIRILRSRSPIWHISSVKIARGFDDAVPFSNNGRVALA